MNYFILTFCFLVLCSILLLLSVFCSHDSQLVRMAGSYPHLPPLTPTYTASLQLLFYVVCSTGFCFWRSDTAAPGRPLSLVACRSAADRCQGWWVLGQLQYPMTLDIAWFAGTSLSKHKTAEEAPLHVHHICAYLTALTLFTLHIAYPLWPVNPDE